MLDSNDNILDGSADRAMVAQTSGHATAELSRGQLELAGGGRPGWTGWSSAAVPHANRSANERWLVDDASDPIFRMSVKTSPPSSLTLPSPSHPRNL